MKARFLGPTLLAMALASCAAPSFEREWKQALAAGAPRDSMEGPWTGSWRSHVNGHHGKLRCVVKPSPDGAGHEFRYWAQWNVFQRAYAVNYPIRKTKDGWTFQGETDLGKLSGGVYRHDGQATPTKFQATYRSSGDHGEFAMSRP